MKASIARICWCALNHPSSVKCFEVGKCGGQFGRGGTFVGYQLIHDLQLSDISCCMFMFVVDFSLILHETQIALVWDGGGNAWNHCYYFYSHYSRRSYGLQLHFWDDSKKSSNNYTLTQTLLANKSKYTHLETMLLSPGLGKPILGYFGNPFGAYLLPGVPQETFYKAQSVGWCNWEPTRRCCMKFGWGCNSQLSQFKKPQEMGFNPSSFKFCPSKQVFREELAPSAGNPGKAGES